jgi:hypothetical protein
MIDHLTNGIFTDLLYVGTRKALGWLPLSTIKMYGGENAIKELIDWANENHYDYKCTSEVRSNVASGALFIWDEVMLGEILYKYKDILTKANIPIIPEDYVEYTMNTTIRSEVNLSAYIVIGFTFNDKRFSGKSLKENIKIYENDPKYSLLTK